MPGVIDPETLHVDELPGVWAPVQWELSEEERAQEVENQATSSLLASVDIPEAILRLLLNELGIEVCYEPPEGYNPEEQGEWDPNLLTFAFSRPMVAEHVERTPDRLVAIYNFGDRGRWAFEIEGERVLIERV